jgi:hypothetical protein
MLEGYHAGDLVDYRIVVTGYVGEYKNAKLELHYKQVNDSGGAIAFVEACNIYIEEINQSLEILGPTEVTQGNNVYIQYNIDWSEITGLGEKFIIRFSGELSTSSSRWKGDNIDVAFGKDKGRETINLKKPGDPEAIPTGSISGYKYNDLNGDGNWDEDEYAASIFNATIGDGTMFEFNGNVRNFGLIDNLPEGCCVEVPILASKRGLDPIHVGPLPDHLAILNNISARCEELAVEAAITGDPRKVFHAICFDPLTSAVLSLAEIKEMVDEMFEKNKDWLPQFKHRT